MRPRVPWIQPGEVSSGRASSDAILLHLSLDRITSQRAMIRLTLDNAVLGLWLVLLTSGCGSDLTQAGSGSVSVLLEPETTILNGLEPGEAIEQIQDGWTVTFDKYVVGIGHIQTHLGSDQDTQAEANDVFLVDLKTLRADGEALWKIDNLSPGRWTFGYEFSTATNTKRHDSVSESDYERMKDEDLTHLITGALTKETGVSCPPTRFLEQPTSEATGENAAGDKCYPNTSIRFEFAAHAPAFAANCEQDGLPGFVISNNRTTSVAITVHGDHLFFNGFPESNEGGIVRLGQLWADTDVNLDGEISAAEYGPIFLPDMSEWDESYQKGGAPLAMLSNVNDLVVGQLKTQGHMDGEGECSVEGVSHDHAEE